MDEIRSNHHLGVAKITQLGIGLTCAHAHPCCVHMCYMQASMCGFSKEEYIPMTFIYPAKTVEPYVVHAVAQSSISRCLSTYTHLGRHDKGVVYIHPSSTSNSMPPQAVWQSRPFHHYKRLSSCVSDLQFFCYGEVRHKFTCSVPYQTKISTMHMHTSNRAWQLIGHMHDSYKTLCNTRVSPDLTQKTTASATGFRIIKHVIV
jgi:hypothetical protein